MRTTIFLSIILCHALIGCIQHDKESKTTQQMMNIGIDYELTSPDKVFQLPYDLQEISGLSYFRDSIVVAVQDELGKLFFYDYKKGNVLDVFSFGNEGDYEGVEVVGDMIYVVKSNGNMHVIDAKAKKIELVKTKLKIKNDVEGLAYDSLNHQLIFACKGSPSLNKKAQKGKSFYAYNIDLNELIEEPLFNVTNKRISSFLKKEKKKTKVNEFKPSGIAIHPITRHIYVLAHGGKLLLVFDESYEIIGLSSLRDKLFRQPEGICFIPNGDLLISNEGQGGRATLLYFKYAGRE